MLRNLPTLEGDIYTIRNPLVLLKGSGSIVLTDGTELRFDKANRADMTNIAIFAINEGVKFGPKKGQWKIDQESGIIETPQKLRFHISGLEPTIFGETFLYDVHFAGFDLKDKVVVEAGAFIGDTALYYASMGATVYSFEPDLESFQLAKRNLALNEPLSRRIQLYNYALGKDGEVDFPVNPSGSGGSSIHLAASAYRRVRSVSLKTVLEEFNIEKPYLLHLDVKGEEFTIIEESDLSRFERVRIEYSPYLVPKTRKDFRDLDFLMRRLAESGFVHTRIYKHNSGRYDLHNHGTIDASK